MLAFFYEFWSRAMPLLDAMLVLVGFIPLIFRWRDSRHGTFFFCVTVAVVACMAPYAYCFPGAMACVPAVGIGAALVKLVRAGRLDGGAVPVRLHALTAGIVLLTAAVFWAEYRLPVPPGVQLRAPLSGPVVVRQGGQSTLFNHHISAPTQRWALDIMRPWAARDVLAYLRGRSEDASSFGMSVYAPCRGEVLVAWDDLPDQPIGRSHPTIAPGNIIVLLCQDTSPAAVVRLAHLRQGSLRIARGAQVAAGELLAEVGNTGNTSMPHLHVDAQTVVDGGTRAGLPLPIFVDGRFLRALHTARFVPAG